MLSPGSNAERDGRIIADSDTEGGRNGGRLEDKGIKEDKHSDLMVPVVPQTLNRFLLQYFIPESS